MNYIFLKKPNINFDSHLELSSSFSLKLSLASASCKSSAGGSGTTSLSLLRKPGMPLPNQLDIWFFTLPNSSSLLDGFVGLRNQRKKICENKNYQMNLSNGITSDRPFSQQDPVRAVRFLGTVQFLPRPLASCQSNCSLDWWFRWTSWPFFLRAQHAKASHSVQLSPVLVKRPLGGTVGWGNGARNDFTFVSGQWQQKRSVVSRRGDVFDDREKKKYVKFGHEQTSRTTTTIGWQSATDWWLEPRAFNT